MPNYIDREDYCRNICNCPGLNKGCSKEECNIWHAPSVDAELVVHGRWIKSKLAGEEFWSCSNCKTIGSPSWKRCPVCEAKMALPTELRANFDRAEL